MATDVGNKRLAAARQTRTNLIETGLVLSEELGLEGLSVNAVVAAAGVSKYDLPEFLLCLAELPLTASGKIVKRELVRWVAEGQVQPQPLRTDAPVAAEG